MNKYGKSYGDISYFKRNFVSDNIEHLKENEKIGEIYKHQSKREKCKICHSKVTFNSHKTFVSHGLQYSIFEVCGHINGAYQETNDFTCKIYEGADYGRNYHVDSPQVFNERIEKIYLPKVQFLEEVFMEKKIKYKNFHYLDVGAGSGYFVGALRNEGLNARGIEVSSSQVEYGNKMLGNNYLVKIDENITEKYILEAKEQVVSFIGVWST